MSDQANLPEAAPLAPVESGSPGVAQGAAPGDPAPVQEQTVTVTELPGSVELPPEDQVRRDLAFFLLYIVVGVMLAGVLLIALTPSLRLDLRAVESTVQLFFAAVITLASTVFGFYFASRGSK